MSMAINLMTIKLLTTPLKKEKALELLWIDIM